MAPKHPRKPTAKAIATRQAAATRPPPPQEPSIEGSSNRPLPPPTLAIPPIHQPDPSVRPPTPSDPVHNPYTVQLQLIYQELKWV